MKEKLGKISIFFKDALLKVKNLFGQFANKTSNSNMPRKLKENVNKVLDPERLKTVIKDLRKMKLKDLKNFKLPQVNEAQLFELGQKFENFIHGLFLVKSRKKIHQYFVITAFIVFSYNLGKITALVLQKWQTPPHSAAPKIYFQPTSTKEDLAKIEKQNIFKTQTGVTPSKEGPSKQVALNVPCNESNNPTQLPIRLMDTVVIQDSQKSLASIQLRNTGEPIGVRQGDKVEQIAIIGKIDRLKVFLRNVETGQCEYILNQEGLDLGAKLSNILDPIRGKALIKSLRPQGISNVGNDYRISRSLLNEKISNPSQILSEAKAVQIFNPDGSVAFKLIDVQPGGFFSYLGVQQEDIITQINGKKVTNLAEVFNLFQNVKNLDHLGITVNRDGQDMDLNYKVGD